MSRQRLIYMFIGLLLLGATTLLQRFNAPSPNNQGASVASIEGNTASSTIDTATSTLKLYLVDRVIDGDTVKVFYNGATTTMRLIGINTPETVDPRRPVQCFGREASAEAHRLLDGKSVAVELDPSQGTYDKYHRTLAYLFLPAMPAHAGQAGLPDGTFFNEYMIAAGYAYEYTYDLPYKYQQEFKAAQAQAEAAQKGLWSPSTCDGKK